MGTRVATAAVLLAVFAAAVFFAPRGWWLGFCAIAMMTAAWEWGRLARLSVPANALFVVCLAAVLVGLFLPSVPPAWKSNCSALAAAFWLLVAPVWLWRRLAPAAPWLIATGSIVLVSAFAGLASLRDTGPWILLSVLSVVWISDTAAFFAGRRFGRRKLAPATSPGKTWEGLWFGLAAVALCAGMVAVLVPEREGTTRASLMATALGLALLGVLGDLFESRLKRAAGVKDSGTWLPGHGGVLDRIDALLPVLPVAAWLFGQ